MTDDPLALRFEHAFDIRINFDRRWMLGPMNGGDRIGYTSVGEGGTVSGPRLNGRLVDYSGADWPVVRTDNVVEVNAHYMIQADDGALIYIRNLGYVHGPVRSSQCPPDAEPDIAPYFRCTPYFRAPEGPYEWLNRMVVIGTGKRVPKVHENDPPDHSLFRYYVLL